MKKRQPQMKFVVVMQMNLNYSFVVCNAVLELVKNVDLYIKVSAFLIKL